MTQQSGEQFWNYKIQILIKSKQIPIILCWQALHVASPTIKLFIGHVVEKDQLKEASITVLQPLW